MAPVREPFARRYSTCGNRVRRCDSRLCAIGGRKPDRRPYPHVLVYETLDGCQANVERGVREEDARAVVQKREIDVPGRHGRRRIMGRIESRTLNVVIEETDDKIWMRSVSWV